MTKSSKPERPIRAIDTESLDQLYSSIGRYEPPAPSNPHVKWVRIDADYIFESDGHIAILPVDNERWQVLWNRPPFVISDVHTPYEWSMAASDRHPYHPAFCIERRMHPGDEASVEERRRRAITFSDRTESIYEALTSAYFNGELKPILRWDERPTGDWNSLVFRRDDVLVVLDKLGADTEVIRLLRAEREGRTDNQAATAHTPTISLQEAQKILKELGPMPEGKARKAIENRAPNKRVPRQRVRDAIDILGWPKKRGRPGPVSNT
jgi:hypothetical protein